MSNLQLILNYNNYIKSMLFKISEKAFYLYFLTGIFIFQSSICNSKNPETGQLANDPKYAVATQFTPVLNTPDFEHVFGGRTGAKINLDSKGLIREMEFIAFPDAVFEVHETINKEGYEILRVTTNDYKYDSSPLYIDSRFVKYVSEKPLDRIVNLPSREDIAENLLSLEGYPYMWGGNFADGISRLLEYYQPASQLDSRTKDLWCLKGVDCSGLIYQASGGALPRNTSSMIKYGHPVEIQGLTADQIAGKLQSLDLLVWSGHVVIVLDENTAIESSPGKGVHKSNLTARLKSIIKERKAVNDWDSSSGNRFVVRRWY
jgi:cell wall-associated NlpC family hydrolase